jgi:hypothetical protein
MEYDINKIMAEYGDDDFGFTAVDEAEYDAVIAEKDETVEEYKTRLTQVEKIIMPFLTNPIFIGLIVVQSLRNKSKKYLH